jgi:hypothetical protein
VYSATAAAGTIGIYDGQTLAENTVALGAAAWTWLTCVKLLAANADRLVFRMTSAQGIISYFCLPTICMGSAPPAKAIPSPFVYGVWGPGTQRGDAVLGTYLGDWREAMILPGLVDSTWMKAGVAPTGAALIYDVNKNNATMYSTKPQIAAGATFGSASPDGNHNLRCFAQQDILSVDCDQIGSSEAGESVTAKVITKHYPHPFGGWAPGALLEVN